MNIYQVWLTYCVHRAPSGTNIQVIIYKQIKTQSLRQYRPQLPNKNHSINYRLSILAELLLLFRSSNGETSKSHHTDHTREIFKNGKCTWHFLSKKINKVNKIYLLLFVSFVDESSFSFVCWSIFMFEENFLTTGVTIINLNVSRNCLEDKVWL